MKVLVSLFILLLGLSGFSQVEVEGNNTPAPSAELHVKEDNSNPKGVLFPRLTTAEMRAIANPANGLIIFNTDYKRFMYYSNYKAGTADDNWVCMGGMHVVDVRSELEPPLGNALSQGFFAFESSSGKPLYFNGTDWTELCTSGNTIIPTVNNP